MTFFSFRFLIFLCVLVLAYGRGRSKLYRRVLLTAANIVFLLTLQADLRDCLFFGLFLLGGYGLLCFIRTRPSRIKLALFTIIAIGALIYLKQYDFLHLLLPPAILMKHALVLVGISYMTFKLIHMLTDLYQGHLPDFDLASYLNYQIGFFSLIAGPIQRYADFHDFWANIDRDLGDRQAGLQHWSRIMTGLMKLGVLAAMVLWFYAECYVRLPRAESSVKTLGMFLGLFYAYPLYIYFNFSGYCDVVIGAAGLLGMRQQENFDHPFRARNLIDFWNRWHISLSMWIRDYVFITSYKSAAERWPAFAPTIGYILLFTALFLAGIWHGSTWNFVVFGVIHGIGVAANQIYADVLKRQLGAAGFRRYIANPWIRRVSIATTFHYVCFAFLFFTPGLSKTLGLLKTVGTRVLE
jgi:D-alanyl-lipoteichoic acid acyltransferase DltB (MBOAT superfamily)